MRINPYRIVPVYKSAIAKDKRKETLERVQETKQTKKTTKGVDYKC